MINAGVDISLGDNITLWTVLQKGRRGEMMKTYKIVIILGARTGPEVIEKGLKIFKALSPRKLISSKISPTMIFMVKAT